MMISDHYSELSFNLLISTYHLTFYHLPFNRGAYLEWRSGMSGYV
jgi:hypothetical protein